MRVSVELVREDGHEHQEVLPVGLVQVSLYAGVHIQDRLDTPLPVIQRHGYGCEVFFLLDRLGEVGLPGETL